MTELPDCPDAARCEYLARFELIRLPVINPCDDCPLTRDTKGARP